MLIYIRVIFIITNCIVYCYPMIIYDFHVNSIFYKSLWCNNAYCFGVVSNEHTADLIWFLLVSKFLIIIFKCILSSVDCTLSSVSDNGGHVDSPQHGIDHLSGITGNFRWVTLLEKLHKDYRSQFICICVHSVSWRFLSNHQNKVVKSCIRMIVVRLNLTNV